MTRRHGCLLLAVLSLAVLTGCSASQIADEMPPAVALPADAPARPATPYVYPAVHDMPPPRSTEPMSAEDQLKMEKELAAARDRQAGRKPADEKTSPSAKKTVKKKPAGIENGETAGANTGAKTNP
jgi:hypothetical protein